MKINIRTLNNTDPVSVEIDDAMKVEDLKKKVEEALHVQPDKQKLIFQGQVLQDSKVLTEAGLFNECAIHMIEVNVYFNVIINSQINYHLQLSLLMNIVVVHMEYI